MKQETGNNLYVGRNHRELSIQITLSGFSFCIAEDNHRLYSELFDNYDFEAIINQQIEFDSVKIGWATDMVQIVPMEVFDPNYASDYLKCANMLSLQDIALSNDTLDMNMVAVWSVHKAIFEAIDTLYPTAYHYHNLQLDVSMAVKQSVRVTIENGNANIVVSNVDGIEAIETVIVTSPENLLYVIMKLNAADSFARNSLIMVADNLQPYEELMARNFKTVEFSESTNIYHNIILRCE